MDGITFMVDELVPAGRYVLLRRHTVAAIGDASVLQKYRTGDIVCVNQATFDGLTSPRTPKTEESAS